MDGEPHEDEAARLMEVYLDRVASGADGRRVEAELRAAHPAQAEALARALASIRNTGLERTVATGGGPPERLGEYVLDRRIGGGGMGVVYLAHQSSLDRVVALKVLRADQLYMDGARARFQREVEAVARLTHPNIAPLYTVGEEHGVPFCAMEFIPGVSLDVALRRLAGSRVEELSALDLRATLTPARAEDEASSVGDPTLFEGSWTGLCLRIVREIASALQHAHERGVLHRDLKPSNVMVTSGGRVVLLDFGLAGLRAAQALTQTGTAVGSLPYMAPEQAAGRTREVDERTDIYGLGVLLYELLTLRVPFSGRHVEKVRAAILEGACVPLRRLNGEVSRDVEVVVARAMDLDRSRRYARAEDLARDLTNVLERRPIEARPASLLLRCDRWVRRKPALAAALALGAVTFVGGPLVFGALQARHARSIGASLAETDALLTSALAAVGEVLRPLADQDLMESPGLQDLRVRSYRRALELLDELDARRADDPRIGLERARVEAGLGRALLERGRQPERAEALALLDSAERAFASSDARVELAWWIGVQHTVALARLQAGENEAGLAALDTANATCRAALVDAPNDAELTLLLARGLAHLAAAHENEGRRARVSELAAEARSRAREAVHLDPTNPRAHALEGVTVALAARASAALADGQPWITDEFVRALEDARACHARALERAPGSRSIQAGVARASLALGNAYRMVDRFDDARDALTDARERYEGLAARFPEVREYHARRISALSALANLAAFEGRGDEALALNDEVASASLERVRELDTFGLEHINTVGVLTNAASEWLLATERGDARFARAEEWLAAARALYDELPPELYPQTHVRNGVLLTVLESHVPAGTGRYDAAVERLEVADGLGANEDPQMAGLRADAWRNVWQRLPADDARRPACLRAAAGWMARALDLGLPAEALTGDALYAPLLDDPRVIEALARQSGD